MKMENKKRVTLTGILTAAEWDDDGNVVEVNLAANDECEYLVLDSVKKRKLFKLLQKQIRVEATMEELDHGNKGIRITRYQEVSDADDFDQGFTMV